MKYLLPCCISYLCILPAIAQTFPRAVPGGYDRTNETDGINYENVLAYKPCKPAAEFIRSDLAFQGYEESQPSQGMGEVTYYYRTNNLPPTQPCPDPATNPKVSKPIIVLDGFDPQDKRAGAELYGKYLKYTQTQSNQVVLLANIVRPQGYDLVILNFPRYETGTRRSITYTPVAGWPAITISNVPIIRDGGADYIERNAFVLIKLIQQLNQELRSQSSTEKITLIGPSMGGMISRYALAYMEKKLAENPSDVPWRQQWDANVKLWISFDAPHLGANIPIGDQWMINYLAGVPMAESAKRARDQRLASTAAKQLLLHHFLSGSDAVAGAPGFRDRFVTSITTNGLPNSAGQLTGFPNPDNDPAKVRKVALVNGSQHGIILPGSPCGQAIRVEINKSFGLRLLLMGALSSTKRLIDATAYFAPANGNTCKVFEGASVYPLGIGIPGRTRFAGAFNSGTGLDLAPGGKLDTQDLIERSASAAANKMIKVVVTNPTPDQSFIPTKSALAYNWKVTGGIGSLEQNLSGRNLACEGIIPFNTYYAPVQNEDHVSLTQQSTEWILNEIKGEPRLNPLPAFAVAGPDLVCNTATYSVSPAPPAGATVAWSTNNANVGITPGGVVTRLNNYTGPAVVTASVNSSCGNGTLTKAVAVQAGPTQFTGTYSYATGGTFPLAAPNNNVRATGITVTLNPAGLSGFTWQRLSTSTTVPWSASGNVLNFTLPPYGGSGFRVTATNSCGNLLEATYAFYNTSGSTTLRLYPNPADGELNVQAASTDSAAVAGQAPDEDAPATAATVEADVRLLDAYGQTVRQGKMRKGRLSFNTAGLRNGLYYLRAEDNETGFSETKQVFIGR